MSQLGGRSRSGLAVLEKLRKSMETSREAARSRPFRAKTELREAR